MRKGIIFVSLVVVVLLGMSSQKVSAIQIEGPLVDMGTITITEPEMQIVKIYIGAASVDFIESTGVTVFTRTYYEYTWWGKRVTLYEYYFYEDKFVDIVVEERTLHNDIDSLIFMVSELEKIASDYGCSSVKNCVLGYIRGINGKYSENSTIFDQWPHIAGDIDYGYVNYVEQVDGYYGIEFNEFFWQYLSSSNVYNEDYPLVNPEQNNLVIGQFLNDPFNSGSYIDVTHMFASMDGIYHNTGNDMTLLYNDRQKDLASWAGDLHTFTKDLYVNNIDVESLSLSIDVGYGYSNVNKDLCDWVGISNCSFPEEDMLADIDAMNITKTFIDVDKNSISSSLSAYYNIINHDNSIYPNRYKMFLNTVTMEVEDSSPSSDIYTRFKDETFRMVNIRYSNYSYSNYNYYVPNTDLGLSLLRVNGMGSSIVPYEYRLYASRLYVNYIIAMSSVPYYTY